MTEGDMTGSLVSTSTIRAKCLPKFDQAAMLQAFSGEC